VQAGASEDGRNLAAETADVIFAAAPTVEVARAFYADVKARVARCGRDPDHVLIMPGFQVMLGGSEQEARDRFEFLQNLIPDPLGVRHLSTYIGVELSGYPVDGPLPDLPMTHVNVSRTKTLFELARRENLTIRQLYQRIAGGRGHFQTFGTARQVADMMEEWATTGAADGFNYMAPLFPGQLEEFIRTVIPELQRRGLYRTRYEAGTLRGNLGLPRRESRYANSRAAANA
jgi:alkanesulfonate monooxygenase